MCTRVTVNKNMLKADAHRAIDKKNSRHFLPKKNFFGENLQNTNTLTLHFFAYWITLSYTYIYCYDWLDRYRKKYEEKLITAHNALNREKKTNFKHVFGAVARLPQRLKSTFSEIFSKNIDFSLWGNCATAPKHVFEIGIFFTF